MIYPANPKEGKKEKKQDRQGKWQKATQIEAQICNSNSALCEEMTHTNMPDGFFFFFQRCESIYSVEERAFAASSTGTVKLPSASTWEKMFSIWPRLRLLRCGSKSMTRKRKN